MADIHLTQPTRANNRGTKARASILALLAANPDGMRTTDLAEQLGMAEAGVLRHLYILCNLGEVERHEVHRRHARGGRPAWLWSVS